MYLFTLHAYGEITSPIFYKLNILYSNNKTLNLWYTEKNKSTIFYNGFSKINIFYLYFTWENNNAELYYYMLGEQDVLLLFKYNDIFYLVFLFLATIFYIISTRICSIMMKRNTRQ